MKTTDRETIRVATDADIEAIRRLVNQAFDVERFLKKGGGDRLQGDGELESLWQRGAFLVKEEDGAAVGCVYVELSGDRAYLGLLSIAPERQGAGLGRQLNAAAESFARQQGASSLA
jgi:predicted N-acetyltransferase YhbS